MTFERTLLILKGAKISYRYMIDMFGQKMDTGQREDLEDTIKEVDRATDVLKAQEIIEQNN